MNKKEIKIFVDFDGTITIKDIGEEIFKKFGDKNIVDRVIDDLLNDRISSRQCWEELCKSVEQIEEDHLKNFIDELPVDSTFKNFIDFCKSNNLDVIVLSDGFDFYIERVFNKVGINGIKYYSNLLMINEGKLLAKYPYYDADSPTSANCKKNHIINHSSDDDFTIYIGDGNSDKDAAQYCDFIFAKKDLARFCSMERISFFPFNDFIDVQNKITELIKKKNLKKRHQAQLKRKSAYIAE